MREMLSDVPEGVTGIRVPGLLGGGGPRVVGPAVAAQRAAG